jgi:hypothetical protein
MGHTLEQNNIDTVSIKSRRTKQRDYDTHVARYNGAIVIAVSVVGNNYELCRSHYRLNTTTHLNTVRFICQGPNSTG